MADKRRIINQLPTYLQSDTLQKFFGATVDHLYQPKDSAPVSGFIGRRPPYMNPSEDFYIPEGNKSRAFYQLEPAMFSEDIDKNHTNSLFYEDLVRNLKAQGANTDNESRLFEQEYYSWHPPIDDDKMLNFAKYYWVPWGPYPIEITDSVNPTESIVGKAHWTGHHMLLNPETNALESTPIKLSSGMVVTFPNSTNSQYENVPYLQNGDYSLSFSAPVGSTILSDLGLPSTVVPGDHMAVEVTIEGSRTFTRGDEITINGRTFSAQGDALKITGTGHIVAMATGDAIKINGHLVTFTGTTPGHALSEVITTINHANIPGITAHDNLGFLLLEQTIGNSIQIEEMVAGSAARLKLGTGTFTSAPTAYELAYDINAQQIPDVQASTRDGNLIIGNQHLDRYGRQKFFLVEKVGRGISLIDWTNEVPGIFAGSLPGQTDQYHISELKGSVAAYNKLENIDFAEFANSKPEYSTIERASDDKNVWSQFNRWFHRDNLSFDQWRVARSYQAQRPIIEFKSNLRLYNYGYYRREDVDVLYTMNDDSSLPQLFKQFNGRNFITISGKTLLLKIGGNPKLIDDYTITTIQGVQITEGLRVISPLDIEDGIRGRIFKLTTKITPSKLNKRETEIVSPGKLSWILVADGLDESGLPSYGDIIGVQHGILKLDRGSSASVTQNLWFNGISWVTAQNNSNQIPLFEMYDVDENSIGDLGVYPDSGFIGNPIFGYQIRNENPTDHYVKLPIVINSDGEPVFENYQVTNRVSYRDGPINGFYFYQQYDKLGTKMRYSNSWHVGIRPSVQFVADELITVENTNVYTISQVPDYTETTIRRRNLAERITNITVSLSGKALVRDVDYSLLTDGNGNLVSAIQLAEFPKPDQLLIVRTYARTIPNGKSIAGFYEIPMNLHANADNEEISTIARNELFDHFVENLSKQAGFSGRYFEKNNYRDTLKEENLGGLIVQNSAGLLRLMLLNSSEDLNLPDAIRFAEHEYVRFQAKFIQKISDSVVNQVATYFVNGSPMNPEEWAIRTLKEMNIGKSKRFPFTYSGMAGENTWIPSTPSFLGVAPLYQPTYFVDDTFLDSPKPMIRCHDGSQILRWGDYRDDIILALEQMIYDSANEQFRGENPKVFWTRDLVSTKWYKADYYIEEYNGSIRSAFERWAVENQANYRKNSTFDQTNPWTWNYRGIEDREGERLPGHWRQIYRQFYGTDLPHIFPWEMLGFINMPTWWTDVYGPAPYASGNTTLWNDISTGTIREGDRAGTDLRWAKPYIFEYMPVDTSGRLLDPVAIGIPSFPPNVVEAQRDWEFGDGSPIENAWRRGSSFPYSLALGGYLLKPAQFVETSWDTINVVKVMVGDADAEQWVNRQTNSRTRSKDMFVHGEGKTDGTIVTHIGVQQWVSDRIADKGLNLKTYFGDRVRGLISKLAHKVGGFVDSSSLSLNAENFGGVPTEDIKIELYRSTPLASFFYGGVVIEWMGSGWKVYGYDVLDPHFYSILPNTHGKKVKVTVAGTALPDYPNWRSKTNYPINFVVINDSKFFRCSQSHMSSNIFETIYWEEVKISADNDSISVYDYLDKNPKNIIEKIPYGTIFKSRQDVFDFLRGWQRYLEAQGFVFDEINPEVNKIRDWGTAGEEFLFWSGMEWVAGTFIAISPTSQTLKFRSTYGTVNAVERIQNGVYSLLDKTGRMIDPRVTNVTRYDDQLEISSTIPAIDIYAARFSISEIEHVISLNNTTKFNDIIYRPILNLRQVRLNLSANRTKNWVGRQDAPGFIVTNNTITTNFEKTVDDFRHFYDIETQVENMTIREHAQHLIGYQPRSYMTNLMFGSVEGLQFYQGMIQQKGGRGALTKLVRSSFVSQESNLQFFEEWAFRLGEYGAVSTNHSIDFRMTANDYKVSPQLVEFGTNNYSNWPSKEMIDIYDLDSDVVGLADKVDLLKLESLSNSHFVLDDPYDDVITLTDGTFLDRTIFKDPRWLVRPHDGEQLWPARELGTHQGDLPNAGPVLPSDVEQVVSLPNEIDIELPHDTVWLFNAGNGSWDVWSLRQGSGSPHQFIQQKFNAGAWSQKTITETGISRIETIGYVGHGNNWGIRVVGIGAQVKPGQWIEISGTDVDHAPFAGVYPVRRVIDADNIEVESFTFKASGWATSSDQVAPTSDDISASKAVNVAIPMEPVGGYMQLGPIVKVYKSMRFKTMTLLNDTTPPGGWKIGDIAYVEDYSAVGFGIMQRTQTSWIELRAETAKIDSRRLVNALLYNQVTDRVVTKLQVWDPYKGLIPGLAEAEIYYKLPYDPAKYNKGNKTTFAIEPELAWGEAEVGRLWWDVSRVRYLDYEIGNNRDRRRNWGKQAPGSAICLYEWVRSLVPPADWTDYVGKAAGNESVSNNYRPSGTAIFGTNTPYVERTEYDSQSGRAYQVYFFWVLNPEFVPPVSFRNESAARAAAVITDPNAFAMPWFAVINQNAIITGGIDKLVHSTNTVLRVNWKVTDSEAKTHRQWALIRQGDGFQEIPNELWNKLTDSVCGADAEGNTVPDPQLTSVEKYGNLIRPRQSWFKDYWGARQNLVECVNTMLSKTPVTISKVDWNHQDVMTSGTTEPEISETWVSTTLVGKAILQSVANPKVPSPDQLVFDVPLHFDPKHLRCYTIDQTDLQCVEFINGIDYDVYPAPEKFTSVWPTADYNLVAMCPTLFGDPDLFPNSLFPIKYNKFTGNMIREYVVIFRGSQVINSLFYPGHGTRDRSITGSYSGSLKFNTVGDQLRMNDTRYVQWKTDDAAGREYLYGISIGDQVLVKYDETVGKLWKVYKLDSLNKDLTFTRNWTAINYFTSKTLQNRPVMQFWKLDDFWEYTDWYGSDSSGRSYTTKDTPRFIFATKQDRDQKKPFPNGSLVAVQDDGYGRWVWNVWTMGAWEMVAMQNGTIKLSANLYDRSGIKWGFGNPALYPERYGFGVEGIGWDSTKWEYVPWDWLKAVGNTVSVSLAGKRDGSEELRRILLNLRENVLTTEQSNELFFSMVNYALVEHNFLDWAFKTSFMVIGGFNQQLRQIPVQTADSTQNLIQYIEEVKPYHTKIRDFIQRYATQIDDSIWAVTDFDKPIYYDQKKKEYRVLNPNDATDQILLAKTPWNFWKSEWDAITAGEIVMENSKIRHGATRILYDRVSCAGIKNPDWIVENLGHNPYHNDVDPNPYLEDLPVWNRPVPNTQPTIFRPAIQDGGLVEVKDIRTELQKTEYFPDGHPKARQKNPDYVARPLRAWYRFKTMGPSIELARALAKGIITPDALDHKARWELVLQEGKMPNSNITPTTPPTSKANTIFEPLSRASLKARRPEWFSNLPWSFMGIMDRLKDSVETNSMDPRPNYDAMVSGCEYRGTILESSPMVYKTTQAISTSGATLWETNADGSYALDDIGDKIPRLTLELDVDGNPIPVGPTFDLKTLDFLRTRKSRWIDRDFNEAVDIIINAGKMPKLTVHVASSVSGWDMRPWEMLNEEIIPTTDMLLPGQFIPTLGASYEVIDTEGTWTGIPMVALGSYVGARRKDNNQIILPSDVFKVSDGHTPLPGNNHYPAAKIGSKINVDATLSLVLPLGVKVDLLDVHTGEVIHPIIEIEGDGVSNLINSHPQSSEMIKGMAIAKLKTPTDPFYGIPLSWDDNKVNFVEHTYPLNDNPLHAEDVSVFVNDAGPLTLGTHYTLEIRAGGEPSKITFTNYEIKPHDVIRVIQGQDGFTPVPVNPWDVLISGGDFVQPQWAENRPEEMIPLAVKDPIQITVTTNGRPGSPAIRTYVDTIRWMVDPLTGLSSLTGPYFAHTEIQHDRALTLFVDGHLQDFNEMFELIPSRNGFKFKENYSPKFGATLQLTTVGFGGKSKDQSTTVVEDFTDLRGKFAIDPLTNRHLSSDEIDTEMRQYVNSRLLNDNTVVVDIPDTNVPFSLLLPGTPPRSTIEENRLYVVKTVRSVNPDYIPGDPTSPKYFYTSSRLNLGTDISLSQDRRSLVFVPTSVPSLGDQISIWNDTTGITQHLIFKGSEGPNFPVRVFNPEQTSVHATVNGNRALAQLIQTSTGWVANLYTLVLNLQESGEGTITDNSTFADDGLLLDPISSTENDGPLDPYIKQPLSFSSDDEIVITMFDGVSPSYFYNVEFNTGDEPVMFGKPGFSRVFKLPTQPTPTMPQHAQVVLYKSMIGNKNGVSTFIPETQARLRPPYTYYLDTTGDKFVWFIPRTPRILSSLPDKAFVPDDVIVFLNNKPIKLMKISNWQKFSGGWDMSPWDIVDYDTGDWWKLLDRSADAFIVDNQIILKTPPKISDSLVVCVYEDHDYEVHNGFSRSIPGDKLLVNDQSVYWNTNLVNPHPVFFLNEITGTVDERFMLNTTTGLLDDGSIVDTITNTSDDGRIFFDRLPDQLSASFISENSSIKMRTEVFEAPSIYPEFVRVEVQGGNYTAKAVATLEATGTLHHVQISNPGQNYSNSLTSLRVVGDGSGAIITPIIKSKVISVVTVVDSGENYREDTTIIAITDLQGEGSGASLSPIISMGKLRGVAIRSAGSGYMEPFATVIDTSGEGTGAEISVQVVNGVIVGVNFVDPGYGYSWATIDVVQEEGGGGFDAVLTPIIARPIKDITVVDGGTGYTQVPNVTIIDREFGAVANPAIVEVENRYDQVYDLTITYAGTGYINPLVIIDSPDECQNAYDVVWTESGYEKIAHDDAAYPTYWVARVPQPAEVDKTPIWFRQEPFGYEQFVDVIPVKAASTRDLVLEYNDLLTNGVTVHQNASRIDIWSATNKLNGVSLEVGDQILIKDQTDSTRNGIYRVHRLFDGTDPMIFVRVIGEKAQRRFSRNDTLVPHAYKMPAETPKIINLSIPAQTRFPISQKLNHIEHQWVDTNGNRQIAKRDFDFVERIVREDIDQWHEHDGADVNKEFIQWGFVQRPGSVNIISTMGGLRASNESSFRMTNNHRDGWMYYRLEESYLTFLQDGLVNNQPIIKLYTNQNIHQNDLPNPLFDAPRIGQPGVLFIGSERVEFRVVDGPYGTDPVRHSGMDQGKFSVSPQPYLVSSIEASHGEFYKVAVISRGTRGTPVYNHSAGEKVVYGRFVEMPEIREVQDHTAKELAPWGWNWSPWGTSPWQKQVALVEITTMRKRRKYL